MDYLGFSKIFKYESYDNFLNKNKRKRIILMTTKAKKHYHKFKGRVSILLRSAKTMKALSQIIVVLAVAQFLNAKETQTFFFNVRARICDSNFRL